METSEARAPSAEEHRAQRLVFDSPSTFGEFYERWHGFVWRTARRLGATDAAAEDIVQDVFLTVYRKHETFEARGSVRAWLAGIVLNTSRRHFRSLSRRREGPLESSGTRLIDEHTPHASAEQREMLALVYHILELMPAQRREMFVMSELEQLRAPEIAAATNLNLNTVYARVRVAREDFAARLKRHRARSASDARRTGS